MFKSARDFSQCGFFLFDVSIIKNFTQILFLTKEQKKLNLQNLRETKIIYNPLLDSHQEWQKHTKKLF
ncbi:hypothetical protein IW18_17165 [Flavobacterium hibernum]|uniref:Uncharacterized protein n=1 Tax=Flavobacterium hibernum TaxID=37752 RepID=A0A0D0EK76_9FLAO|nr:hypothetical protein IW18_17165 [Flavobacterium hibernum]OXA85224.1 hypothetical protein B0A73_17915 [Flavobacterium hibernum]